MLAALLALLVSAPSQALLDKAQKQIDEADFVAAEATLHEALAQPDNDDATLIAIYGQLAVVYLYQDLADEARGAFEKVLYLQPGWTPPEGSSPKVRALFAEVQERFQAAAAPIQLRHEPLKGTLAGRPLVVTAEISGLKEPNRAVLQFRRKLAPAWSSVEFLREDADRFVAIIPGPSLEPGGEDFDYYLEVQDAAGTRLHGAGSAQEPVTFHVEKPPAVEVEERWYQKWWVWAIAGGAAVGIAAAAIVPAALDEPTGTLVLKVTVE